jgi:hypothetical protein
VVGYSHRYNGSIDLGLRAVRWNANSSTPVELANLGTSAGYAGTNAFGINDSNFAAGFGEKIQNGNFVGYHAALWRPDGSVLDLNDAIDPNSGWTLSFAFSISNSGFIAGVGYFDPDGSGPASAYSRAFVVDASSLIPEPTSAWMFLALTITSRAATRLRRRTC